MKLIWIKKTQESQLAISFQVANSFVQKLIKRYKDYGHIDAKSYRPGPAYKFKGCEELTGTTENLEKRLDYWEKIRDIQAKNLVFFG